MSLSPVLSAHLCAFGTATVWGMTFISSKVLLEQYTALEVALYRFVLAMAVMFLLRPRPFRHGGGWRTELLFAGAGATGISIYFFFENVALTYTYASNVSLIVCTAPFFTGLVARIFLGETLHANFFTGFVIAITGIALISFNGASNLGLNPKGDLLTVCAAFSWAFYSMLTRRIFSRGYPLYLATRRILAWGLITLVIAVPFQEQPLTPPHLDSAETWLNFLFLGVMASSLGFLTWNYGLRILGAVKCTAYVYLSPVVTVVAGVIILDEHLTVMSVAGMLMTLAGLILSERHGNALAFLKRSGRNNSEKE
ncbi:MAG: DMT family transporter [Desulfovibrionaceae bacterium]|nr:DMT family transporter [Desulfovibrionaceae bacterium]